MAAHLELCLNDLLHPTEKSVSLLEELTATQLDDIERTLTKIKQKKSKAQQQHQTEKQNVSSNDWALVAAQIAKALTDTMTASNAVTSANSSPSPTVTNIATDEATITPVVTEASITPKTSKPSNTVPNHEPCTEIKDGVEWVSFVYSHHRVLRRYSIRTDIDQVDINLLDDKFKNENCVYPRANLPQEEYKGNRWAYETECNTLGWKLAHLNSSEIAGKRGLIQRAVDSYRNRYPNMRSRRVARQEKLLKGTLRKRKQRDSETPEDERPSKKHEESLPKTVSIDDGMGGKLRVRINVESVSLDAIDADFRCANCVYPRALDINTKSPFASQRQIEEAKCNELAWKLAWLNPKQLANRKNLLQRALDVYRTKFLPELNPRKNSLRMPPTIDTSLNSPSSAHSNIMLSVPTSTNELLASSRLSVSSSGSESVESPHVEEETLFKDASIFDLYQLPSSTIDFDPSEFIKTEDDDHLLNQLFNI